MTREKEKEGHETGPSGGEGVEATARPTAGVRFIDSDKILDKWVLESELPERLGISRSFLRRLRLEQLEPSQWRQGKKGIEVSLAAVKALVGTEIPESGATSEEATLIVQYFWPNPHLLGCSKAGETDLKPSEMQLVRVRNSKKFTRGMEIPCSRKKGQRIWSLACRHPKKKGQIKL